MWVLGHTKRHSNRNCLPVCVCCEKLHECDTDEFQGLCALVRNQRFATAEPPNTPLERAVARCRSRKPVLYLSQINRPGRFEVVAKRMRCKPPHQTSGRATRHGSCSPDWGEQLADMAAAIWDVSQYSQYWQRQTRISGERRAGRTSNSVGADGKRLERQQSKPSSSRHDTSGG